MNEALLRDRALAWLADARPAVVVEVVTARGSVPRGVGTRMVVGAAEALGTIGGGHLELTASLGAAMLARGATSASERRSPSARRSVNAAAAP
jgi:xanthine dehydrogenase accessory factor